MAEVAFGLRHDINAKDNPPHLTDCALQGRGVVIETAIRKARALYCGLAIHVERIHQTGERTALTDWECVSQGAPDGFEAVAGNLLGFRRHWLCFPQLA